MACGLGLGYAGLAAAAPLAGYGLGLGSWAHGGLAAAPLAGYGYGLGLGLGACGARLY